MVTPLHLHALAPNLKFQEPNATWNIKKANIAGKIERRNT